MSSIYIISRSDAFTLDQLIQNHAGGLMMIIMQAAPQATHSAPLATLGGRGMADAAPSPASATHEAERLAGIRKMHRRVAAPRAELGQHKYIDLRDGSLMPPEPVKHSPLYAWIALLVAGMSFWTWALPKVVRTVADSIVIGANSYY